jgi:hypothetical protein
MAPAGGLRTQPRMHALQQQVAGAAGTPLPRPGGPRQHAGPVASLFPPLSGPAGATALPLPPQLARGAPAAAQVACLDSTAQNSCRHWLRGLLGPPCCSSLATTCAGQTYGPQRTHVKHRLTKRFPHGCQHQQSVRTAGGRAVAPPRLGGARMGARSRESLSWGLGAPGVREPLLQRFSAPGARLAGRPTQAGGRACVGRRWHPHGAAPFKTARAGRGLALAPKDRPETQAPCSDVYNMPRCQCCARCDKTAQVLPGPMCNTNLPAEPACLVSCEIL